MPIPLQSVPEEIREYFGSEKVSTIIADVNKKAGIETLTAIPHILFQLEIKTVSVHDFIDAMKDGLSVSTEKAKSITKEIKEKILEHRRSPLFNWGIDISFIDVRDAQPLEEMINVEKTALEEKVVFPAHEKIVFPGKTNVSDSGGDRPLIIHEEKTSSPADEDKKRQRFFSLPFKFFEQKSESFREKPAVRIQLETPDNKKEVGAKKIVHYSELRTSVSPFAGKEEAVSLTRIAPIKEMPKEEKTENKEKLLEPKAGKPPGPLKLDGNLIDLR